MGCSPGKLVSVANSVLGIDSVREQPPNHPPRPLRQQHASIQDSDSGSSLADDTDKTESQSLETSCGDKPGCDSAQEPVSTALLKSRSQHPDPKPPVSQATRTLSLPSVLIWGDSEQEEEPTKVHRFSAVAHTVIAANRLANPPVVQVNGSALELSDTVSHRRLFRGGTIDEDGYKYISDNTGSEYDYSSDSSDDGVEIERIPITDQHKGDEEEQTLPVGQHVTKHHLKTGRASLEDVLATPTNYLVDLSDISDAGSDYGGRDHSPSPRKTRSRSTSRTTLTAPASRLRRRRSSTTLRRRQGDSKALQSLIQETLGLSKTVALLLCNQGLTPSRLLDVCEEDDLKDVGLYPEVAEIIWEWIENQRLASMSRL